MVWAQSHHASPRLWLPEGLPVTLMACRGSDQKTPHLFMAHHLVLGEKHQKTPPNRDFQQCLCCSLSPATHGCFSPYPPSWGQAWTADGGCTARVVKVTSVRTPSFWGTYPFLVLFPFFCLTRFARSLSSPAVPHKTQAYASSIKLYLNLSRRDLLSPLQTR